jgi:hypothetical protein
MFDDIFKVFQVKLFNRKIFNNVRKYKQKKHGMFLFYLQTKMKCIYKIETNRN